MIKVRTDKGTLDSFPKAAVFEVEKDGGLTVKIYGTQSKIFAQYPKGAWLAVFNEYEGP